jgi:hypothetical protein
VYFSSYIVRHQRLRFAMKQNFILLYRNEVLLVLLLDYIISDYVVCFYLNSPYNTTIATILKQQLIGKG